MIARNVTMHLKPNSAAEFTQTFQKEIIPLLRQQKGFQDEITFIVPGGQESEEGRCEHRGAAFDPIAHRKLQAGEAARDERPTARAEADDGSPAQ